MQDVGFSEKCLKKQSQNLNTGGTVCKSNNPNLMTHALCNQKVMVATHRSFQV